MSSRVIVTGAAGFIGSHVCRRLDGIGIDVVGVDCFLPDLYDAGIKRQNAQELRTLRHVSMVEADIREALPVGTFDGVDVVVNLAAMPGLVKSWQDFDLYSSCNFHGVDRLVRQSMDHRVAHFIQISTSSVYGALATGAETDALNPVSPYGVTKLAGEKLVGAYGATQGLPYTVLRYFSVYGPGQRPDMAYHIICERLLADREIPIFGDGLQSRSNTYVADVVDATVGAVLSKPQNATMNVAGGESITLLGAVEAIEAALGRTARLDFQPARLGDQRHTLGDATLASSLLDWRATTGVLDGLRAQAEWHLARHR